VLEYNEMLAHTRLLTGPNCKLLLFLSKTNNILVGYIPGAESLSAVADIVRKLKSKNPNLIYLLDRAYLPIIQNFIQHLADIAVMGDSGRLYVAADVIPVYREMVSLSTVITPNWFEVE
jgi:pyridoxine kinase